MEVGGNKSVAFCGGSTDKFALCFDRRLPFRGDVKNPVIEIDLYEVDVFGEAKRSPEG